MITASEIYDRLCVAYDQPRWWSDDPYVVMVQSVLVQNTSWSSVEKVTDALFYRLTPRYIMGLEAEEFEDIIRPCGFCKRKAATIKRVTEWYVKYDHKTENLKNVDQSRIRNELLSIKGIGAETADVILVYAFYRPSFVIDAYTRRFFGEIGFSFRY